MDSFPYFAGAFISASLYAAILQAIGVKKYHPDWTVLTVIIGVALTGAWEALHLWYAPLPALSVQEIVWWQWWLTVKFFLATGAPITIWQIWQSWRRLMDLIDYLMRSRNVNQADGGSALAEGPGGDPDADD